MKIPLTTLALLLSAAAVHALPADPPLATPPPTFSDGVSDTLENLGSAAGQAIGGIISGIPQLIGDLKDAKAHKEAWLDEQEQKAADDKEEELRKALELRRQVAVDRLSHAERAQRSAEAAASNLAVERDAAAQQVSDLNGQIAKLVERQKAAEAELEGAHRAVTIKHAELNQAHKELEGAIDEADKLREAIAQIDEIGAGVGLDPEDLHELNPEKYPEPPKEPEEPEVHKKKNKHHKNKHHNHD